MHIEPGIVEGAKLTLGFATAAGAMGYSAKLALETAKRDGVAPLAARALSRRSWCSASSRCFRTIRSASPRFI